MHETPEHGENAAPAFARGLSGIVGQDQVVMPLKSALLAGRPHHAYLFDGPEGVGKRTTALALAATLNCTNRPEVGGACGACLSCQKIQAGTHPDVLFPSMEAAGLANEIEQVLSRLRFPPFEGLSHVVILDPADQLTIPTAMTAANRLLKTLEEPLPQTQFVLCATCGSGLLETIRSRCLRLRFVPLPDEAILSALTQKHVGLSLDLREHVVALSQGSLGRAQRLLREPEAMENRQRASETLFSAALSGRVQAMCQVAAEVGQDREEAVEVLDLLWLKLHRHLRDVAKQNQLADSPPLSESLRLLRETQTAIRRYTSAPLSLERLLRLLSPRLQHNAARYGLEGAQ